MELEEQLVTLTNALLNSIDIMMTKRKTSSKLLQLQIV